MKKPPITKLNAKELRALTDLSEKGQSLQIQRNPLYIILDNVYDTYNIGGLFRLSDALAVSGLYICGESETPPNHRITKASIGTYKVVPWRYFSTTLKALEHLRKTVPDIQVVAIEQTPTSVDYRTFKYTSPLALVVGNETSGMSPDVIEASDAVVDIPMYGINTSLNVIVSCAIVAYHIISP